MNKTLKTGLLLQIPNMILLGIILISYISSNIDKVNMPSIDLTSLFYIIVGSLFVLINIASFILIVSGIGIDDKNKHEEYDY